MKRRMSCWTLLGADRRCSPLLAVARRCAGAALLVITNFHVCRLSRRQRQPQTLARACERVVHASATAVMGMVNALRLFAATFTFSRKGACGLCAGCALWSCHCSRVLADGGDVHDISPVKLTLDLSTIGAASQNLTAASRDWADQTRLRLAL